MRITFLGTGTSVGVPTVTCCCAVCTSDDPRNRRLRSSVSIEENGRRVLIDTSVDLRQQALRESFDRLDAILYTHPHADHMLGLDEVRMFNFRQRQAIPAYGSAETLAGIRRTFWYVFEKTQAGGGKPQVDLRPVDGPFEAAGLPVVPFPVTHGRMTITGYRIGEFAYITDASDLPEESLNILEGLDLLVMNALRHSAHPTHQNLDQALAWIGRIGPRRALLTHISHDIDHARVEAGLPGNVRIAYDGLKVEVEPPAGG